MRSGRSCNWARRVEMRSVECVVSACMVGLMGSLLAKHWGSRANYTFRRVPVHVGGQGSEGSRGPGEVARSMFWRLRCRLVGMARFGGFGRFGGSEGSGGFRRVPGSFGADARPRFRRIQAGVGKFWCRCEVMVWEGS